MEVHHHQVHDASQAEMAEVHRQLLACAVPRLAPLAISSNDSGFAFHHGMDPSFPLKRTLEP